jgi:hypothetical protein
MMISLALIEDIELTIYEISADDKNPIMIYDLYIP